MALVQASGAVRRPARTARDHRSLVGGATVVGRSGTRHRRTVRARPRRVPRCTVPITTGERIVASALHDPERPCRGGMESRAQPCAPRLHDPAGLRFRVASARLPRSTRHEGTAARLRHRFEWSFLGSGAYYLRVVWWEKMWRFAAGGKHRRGDPARQARSRVRDDRGVGVAASSGRSRAAGSTPSGFPVKLFVVPFLDLRPGHRLDRVRPPRVA